MEIMVGKGNGGGPRHVEEAKAMTAEMPSPEPPPVTAPEPDPIPATAPAPHQPEFDGVEPGIASPVAASDDDLLDIPAFLRRQAN